MIDQHNMNQHEMVHLYEIIKKTFCRCGLYIHIQLHIYTDYQYVAVHCTKTITGIYIYTAIYIHILKVYEKFYRLPMSRKHPETDLFQESARLWILPCIPPWCMWQNSWRRRWKDLDSKGLGVMSYLTDHPRGKKTSGVFGHRGTHLTPRMTWHFRWNIRIELLCWCMLWLRMVENLLRICHCLLLLVLGCPRKLVNG